MHNVEFAVKADVLTITINLADKGRPSKSGKNTVVATTSGNTGIGKGEYKLGLNVYKPKK